MSTSSSIPATPTPGHGGEEHLNSDVFSSPARGVGWSPGAASAPLGLFDNDSTPNFNLVIDANISPIYRSSMLSLPPKDGIGTLMGSNRNQLVFGHEENLTGGGRVISCPPKPPSTPRAVSLVREGGTHSATSSGISPLLAAHISGGQFEQTTNVKPSVTLSPVSLSNPRAGLFASRVANSPTKPHFGLFFPPPASPPPFAPNPVATAHTPKSINTLSTKFQNSNSRLNSGLPSNTRARHLTFPSAVPLADDPFLATSCLEEGSVFSSKASTGIFNDIEYPSANLVDTSPPDFLAPPTSPLDILPRKRADRARASFLDSRAKVAKAYHHKLKHLPKFRKQPVPHVTSTNPLSSSPLPQDPLLAPTYESFFSSFEHSAPSLSAEPNPDMVLSSTRVVSDVHDDSSVQEGAGWSTPIISHSYTNPGTTLRYMFPTPSLTSTSFTSPLSLNNLATPADNHLFPSPDIVTSPLSSESHAIRGRGKRQRAMSTYATPTRCDPENLEAHELIGGSSTSFSESQSAGNLVRGAQGQEGSSEGGNICNQSVPAGEESLSFRQGVYDTSFDQGSQEYQTLDPRNECYELETTPKKEDIPSSLPSLTSTNIKDALVPTLNPASIYVRKLDAPPTLGKRSRGTSTGGGRSGTKLSKASGGSRIPTTGQTEEGEAQSEPTHRTVYFERPTRSQSRAAAALLALAASSPKPITQTGANVETLATKIGNPAARLTGRVTSTTMSDGDHTPVTKQLPRQPAPRAKRGVVGRAPSRVLDLTTSSPHGNSRPTPDSDTNLSIGPGLKPTISVPAGTSNVVDKTKIEEPDDDASLTKPKPKAHSIPSELLPRPDPAVVYGSDGEIVRRTFPEGFPMNLRYSKWYRRFPVSAFFMKNDPAKEFVLGEGVVIATPRATGSGSLVPNHAPYLNLYIPRFVRGVGADKVGLCAICIEPVWRGGEGQVALFNTKISAYNYHMQYYHGISPRTGLPFSPPIAFRRRRRQPSQIKKLEREAIEEGQCHACLKWISIESVKELDIMVPELYWWKHAASCHGSGHYPQDRDPYIEDSVYLRLQEYIKQQEPEDKDQSASEHDVHSSTNVGDENSATEHLLLQATRAEENQDGPFVEGLESGSDLTDLEDKGVDC